MAQGTDNKKRKRKPIVTFEDVERYYDLYLQQIGEEPPAKGKQRKGWREDKDPSCIGKDGKPKAPEHYKAAVKAQAGQANNAPMVSKTTIVTKEDKEWERIKNLPDEELCTEIMDEWDREELLRDSKKTHNYTLETIDSRQDWYKKKNIKAIGVEKTTKHFIFTTEKGKKTRLRTDTWRLLDRLVGRVNG